MKELKIKFLLPIILLFLVLFFTSFSYGQFSPYFKNHALSDHNAGNQNWGISSGSDGKIYAANNNGLLVYDGLKWTLHQIPNKTTIRSVFVKGDTIYTGSYQEFGYWKKNALGELIYHSLSHLASKDAFLNEEFWQIISHQDAIIFRSFHDVFVYKNNTITRLNTSSAVLSIDTVNNNVYVSTLKDGILILDKNVLKPFINDPLLVDAKVVSVSEYQNKLIISTSLKGCFVFDGNRAQPWSSEINAILKQQQLNSFSKLNNGSMVFGTIKNGVYVTNANGTLKYHVSKAYGLMNNTVLGQFITKDNILWLGLDNGIASVNLNVSHTFFNDATGKLGAVYDVISHKGVIYIGSNTGLYFINSQRNLQFIEGSQGQVWELKDVNGQLFCGHNEGTYLVEGDKITLISNFTGGWVLKRAPERSDVFVQGTYSGLVRFKKTPNGWDLKHLGQLSFPIRFLVFEDKHTAWVSHAYKGLYKITFDDNFDTITSVKNYGAKGLFSDYKVRLYKLKSDICFNTNNGWLKYEPLRDSIVPFEFLNKKFGKEDYIISDENSDMIALKHSNYIEIRSLENDNFKLLVSNNFYSNRSIVGFERISKLNDSLLALNLNDGYMLINKNTQSESNSLSKPKIERIEVFNNLIAFENVKEIEFSASQDIKFFVSSPKSMNHFFEYAFLNNDNLHWQKLDNDNLELSRLKDGAQTIAFRTADNYGNTSEATSIKINVLPPWYKSPLGYFSYFLALVLAFFLFYKLHKLNIKKEQRVLQLKLKKEQREALREKAIENEKKLAELTNQSLKSEVKLKSKQLANTAMSLVKKNETLQELKKELMEQKSSFNNSFLLKKLLNKIDNSISKNDEWKVFEYNFNEVHEEFFNKLEKAFPDLTHKDLKICAYIKMNLSNKEIAPLLNISIRGVETHRYRLKRKLNLENDNSLTTFLRNYK